MRGLAYFGKNCNAFPIVQRVRRFDFSNSFDIVGKLDYHNTSNIQDKYRRIAANYVDDVDFVFVRLNRGLCGFRGLLIVLYEVRL